MTENLYEINDLTNSSNSLNITRCGYAMHSTSLQPSPMSPHVNQKYMPSPTTPQNELSPLLDITHNEGSWDHSQLEKSASSMLNETMNSHVVYPFSIAEALHGLDSFSKAFPVKNPSTVFVNSVGDKSSEDNQVSEILSPQRGTPSAVSDREPFSPVTMQSRPMQCHNQLMQDHLDSQNMAHNAYQSHQQYYGYQQNKPQLRQNNLAQVYKVPFNKSQNQYLLQHQGHQIHQHQQLQSYSLAQQKQQISLDVREGHESIGSPTDSYTEDHKAYEQPVFQSSLHTSHFQGSQNFLSLPHQSDFYQQQQANELTHSFPFKQNPSFEDHLGSGEIMPGFSNTKEEVYMDLNYHHKHEDFCSTHYQSVGSEVNQTAQSLALRGGGVRHHLNSYRPPCEQMRSSDIQEDQQLQYYRTESSRAEGAKTKMKCILCHREFKSLPALNGHMRSHGGFRTNPSILKTVSLQTDEQIHQSKEVIPIDPMVFPVSVPVNEYSGLSRLPNNFHNHLRHNYLDDLDESHPQQQKVLPSRAKKSIGAGDGQEKKQEKKRYRHCLVPLVISPCGAGLESRGPVLFQSQLRSPSSCGDDIPYTPPPMLSPIRPGSGLFSSVNTGHSSTGAQTVPRVRLCDKHDCNTTFDSGDNSSRIKPRINIGCSFQADIPDIQSCLKVSEDIHKANLLWTPCYLDTPEKQQRVDDLLKMACSSVLPGGGTNTEYTLHCLFECRGDIMATLDKLLSVTALKHGPSLHTNYHYAGSDKWTLQEKRQLNKALLIHNKDFHLIQKMVKTKSVGQCVEYYYTWKEKLRLGRRFSTGPITPGQVKENKVHVKEGNTRQPTHEAKNKSEVLEFTELSENMFNGNEWNQSNTGGLCNSPAEHNRPKSAQHFASGSVKSSPSNSSTNGDTDSNLIFPCIECGKVFLKVKSRNAHMKTHRQPDDPQFWQIQSFPEQEQKTVTPASPTVHLHQLPLTPHSVSCSNNGDIYINNP